MAGYSARQASYTTGDTILAAHSNDEFNQVLAAFNATTGHTHDGTAGEGGPISTLRDADSNNKILVDSTNNHLEFYVEVSSSAVEQIKIQDGAIVPVTDNDIDLGTSSLEFKDAFFDGTVTADAASILSLALTSGATVTAINDEDDMSSDSATALATQQSIKAYVDSQVTAQDLDLTSDSGTIAIDLDSETLTIQGTSNEIETSATGNALTIGLPNDVTIGNNLTVTGDLTVSGDDITMGTNTSGNLLIADGTNFNSVAVGSLSEISTVADDDVLLAVDTSGGGLKKITRATLTAGILSGSEISNVVEDTTPQLGGNLDMNGNDIVTTSNADLELAPNGTGHVTVRGNDNSGAIQFNCESNSHGQIVKAQPHSAGVTNELLLPDGGNSTLVSLIATQTLTNKTLTTPVIAEIDNSSDITLDAGADIILDAGGGDFNFKVAGTEILRVTNSSSDVIIRPVVDAKDIIFQQRDGTEVARVEDNGTFNVVTDKLAINGTAITSTAAELNILDGVTSTAAELNIMDGGTAASSTTLVDADRLVTNDAGTMKQVALTDVKTYLTSAGFSTDDPTALAIALG